MRGLYQSIMVKNIIVSTPTLMHPTSPELEAVVNDDLLEFQTWFCEHVDTSAEKLSGIEIAILKSYLWWKLHPGAMPDGNTPSR
jgi:hypothetical protein